MNRNSKKGFTIVELIIVIAVIAVLAAVLIPTFSNLIQKANVAADQTLIKNLNTALAMDTTVSKHETMTQALEATKANGFDVEKIVARATDNKIVWDSANDCFAYIEKGKSEPTYIPDTKTDASVADYQLWTIVDSKTLDAKYSSYIAGTSVSGAVEATKGVDVGENTGITAVSYTNTGDKQDVVIRTNSASTKIQVSASLDVVYHYGNASEVIVSSIANESYHEFGRINTLTLKDGHLVVESKAIIENVIVEKTSGKEVSATNNGGVVNKVIDITDADYKISQGKKTVGEQLGIELENIITNSSNKVATEIPSDISNVEYIKLSNDVSLSEAKTIDKDLLLDLNGHTITIGSLQKYDVAFKVLDGTLTIIDSSNDVGKIVHTATAAGLYSPIFGIEAQDSEVSPKIIINSGSFKASYTIVNLDGNEAGTSSLIYEKPFNVTLEINGGTFDGQLDVFACGYGSKVYINGGVFKATNFCLGGNGTVTPNASAAGTYFEVNGGNFESDEIAIYLPQKGDALINGGEFVAKLCIGAKAGNLIINGGSFKATAEYAENPSSLGNGIQKDGSVIFIDSNTGYAGGITMTINDGQFTSEHGHIIREIGNNSSTNIISININGGLYNSAKNGVNCRPVAEVTVKDPNHLLKD